MATTYKFEAATNITFDEPIEVKAGTILELAIIGSAGAKGLELNDNADVLSVEMPSLFGSVDIGDTFEPMSAELMRKLSKAKNDLVLRIDCSQMQKRFSYILYGISCDTELTEIQSEEAKQHFYHDASQRAFDEADLKKAVNDNLIELANAAQDSAGWTVKYYRAERLKNIDVLNTWELKGIKDCKDVTVFFPKRKTLGMLDFDQFGLQYEELTNLHILKTEFNRVYESAYARPDKHDIVYIAFLDQFFEIQDVVDVKTPTNVVQYFDCTMKFLSDRQMVAKDDDILDISSLVGSESKDNMHDYKANEEASKLPSYDEYAEKKWSFQKFSKAQLVQITNLTENAYGIAYIDGWKKVKVLEAILYTAELASEEFDEVPIGADETVDMYFAKYARFNAELSQFDENMYYTTCTIPRTLQPIELIELQTAI